MRTAANPRLSVAASARHPAELPTFPQVGQGVEERDPPEAWKHLALLALGMVMVFSTWFSVTAAIPQLKVKWHLSSGEGSLLTIAVQLGYVASALVLSLLGIADMFNPRLMMGVGAMLAAVANALFLAVDQYAWGIFARVLTGAAIAAVYGPGMKATTTWYRKGRGFALGVMVGALTLGSAMPHLVLGFGGINYKILLLATSGMSLLGAACIFVAGDGPFGYPRAAFSLMILPRVFRETGVMWTIAAHCAHAFSLYGMWSHIQPFYASVFDDPTTASYVVAFVVIAVGAPACVVGGLLADRFGRIPVAVTVTAISSLCTVAIGFTRSVPALCIVIGAVWGAVIISDSAIYSALVTECAVDREVVGTAVTLQTGSSYTVSCLAIYLVGVAAQDTSWTYALDILLIGDAVVLLALFFVFRRNAQKQEENRTGQSSVPATDVDKCNKAISAEELPGYTQTIDINYLESQAKTCEM